jgi:hypothetical protein
LRQDECGWNHEFPRSHSAGQQQQSQAQINSLIVLAKRKSLGP